MPEGPSKEIPDSTADHPPSLLVDPLCCSSMTTLTPGRGAERSRSARAAGSIAVSEETRARILHQRAASPGVPIGYLPDSDCIVNLAGDYNYLNLGYYTSQDLTSSGNSAHPTCYEIMDAYVVPLFLEKAQQAGLPIPSYYISNGYFEPPVIVDTINPFMSRHSVVLKARVQERIAKSLTRNFTYAICCQELPANSRVLHFPAVLGWSASARFRTLAAAVWDTFRIPLAKVRVIACPDDSILLSGIAPLPYSRLSERERTFLDKMVIWRT